MFEDFNFIDFGDLGAEPPKEEAHEPAKKTRRRTTACVELSTRYEYRRAFSETKLLDACGQFDFKPGHSYHFITAGDVDSLSFLKAVLRQQNVKHLLCSTWCMAAEDILQLQQWQEAGKINEIDLYVGEIFPGSYSVEWQMLKDWRNRGGYQDSAFSATTRKSTRAKGTNSRSRLRPQRTLTLIPARSRAL